VEGKIRTAIGFRKYLLNSMGSDCHETSENKTGRGRRKALIVFKKCGDALFPPKLVKDDSGGCGKRCGRLSRKVLEPKKRKGEGFWEVKG